MRRALALLEVGIANGLFAAGDQDDVLAKYTEATTDVPNLTFLDWLFIFNILDPDRVQALSEAFDRTVFVCNDCGHAATGADLDPEDDGIHCPSCGSENTAATDDPSAVEAASSRQVIDSIDDAYEDPDADDDGEGPTFADFEQGLKPGTKLGRCVIEQYVARGGMGVVYRARHLDADIVVAVKVLLTAFTGNKTLALRFREEARAVAQLEHPNIVQVFEYGEKSGHAYFTMQWIEGESLAQRMRRDGQVDVADVIEISAQVCDALNAAHQQSIIHRDIKPDNIMVMPDGLVKLADFGLSKNQQSDLQLSQSGTYVGTPAYLAPEQLGAKVTPKADLYGLACTMYHAITGKLPFTGDDAAEVLQQHLTSPFPSAKNLNPNVPPALDRLLQWMASKNPKHRPADALEVRDRLVGILETMKTRAMRGSGLRSQSGVRGGGGNGTTPGLKRPTTPVPTAPIAPAADTSRRPRSNAIAPPNTRRHSSGPKEAPPLPDLNGPGMVGSAARAAASTDTDRAVRTPAGPNSGGAAESSGNHLISSAPAAPANFPFREKRKVQKPTRIRMQNDGSPMARSARMAATPDAGDESGVDSESATGDWLSNELTGDSKNRWPVIIIGVTAALALLGVVILLSLLARSSPEDIAKSLLQRANEAVTVARADGNLQVLADLDAEVETFRGEHSTVRADDFADVRRQLDLVYLIHASDGRYDAALRRLSEWVDATATPSDATRKLAQLDQVARATKMAEEKLAVLRQPLQAIVDRAALLEKMNQMVARSRTVAVASAAKEFVAQFDAFIAEHPTIVTESFRAERNRLNMLMIEAEVTKRIEAMQAVTDSREAAAAAREAGTWFEGQTELSESLRTKVAAELARLRTLADLEGEITKLLGRATAATTIADAQAVIAEIEAFENAHPEFFARFTEAKTALREKINNPDEVVPMPPSGQLGPLDLQAARTFSFEVSRLSYVGLDCEYAIGDAEVTVVLMGTNPDGTVYMIGAGRIQDDGIQQRRHTYLVRTLAPGSYVFIVQPLENRVVRGATVRAIQFPTDDIHATPAGAVPATVGITDGPHRVSESRWYLLTVGDGGWVDMTIAFNHADGDADLALHTVTPEQRPGARLAIAESITDNERLVYWLAPGQYFVRIYYHEFLDLIKNRDKGGSPVTFSVRAANPELPPAANPRYLDRRFTGGVLDAGDWALSPGQYDITQSIEIPPTASLFIRAGARLSFRPGTGITCQGKLIAQGDAARWVEFVAESDASGWTGLVVTGETAHVNLRRVSFERGSGRKYRFTNLGSMLDSPDNGTKGGALFFLRTQALHLIDDCLFRNCRAMRIDDRGGYGGAMQVEDAAVELRGTAFRGNRADVYGGAIYTDFRACLRLDRCRFEENHSAAGGAVMVSEQVTFAAKGCIFTDNTSSETGGGALFFSAGSIGFLEDGEFTGNRGDVGAAVLNNQATELTVRNSTFTSNRATDVAGALAVLRSATLVDGCRFTTNSAERSGGAIHVSGSPVVITRCTFDANNAPRGADVQVINSESLPEAFQLSARQITADNQFTNTRPSSVDVATVE